jgi:large subunit ribosomal protein L10
MALSRAQKETVVSEVADVAAKAYSVVGAEYRGVTVESITALRVKARESGVYLRVVKNTLARRAVEGTEFECTQDALTGPLMLAFSMEDPGAAARVIKDFAKEEAALQVKLVAVGGQLLPASDLERLAKMPTKDQAIGMLMGVMKAPAEKLVRQLAAPQSKLVRTLAAVREQKEAA